jgi:TolB protein
MTRTATAVLLALLAGLAAPAHAGIRVEITQGVEGAQPVAAVPFLWEGDSASAKDAPVDVAAVVASDLARSGRFKPVPPDAHPQDPAAAQRLDTAQWRTAGIDYVVIGRIARAKVGGKDGFTVRFQLFDALRGSQVLGYSIPVVGMELRRAAHRISDMVYEKLTGQPGAFSTRIAYITELRDGTVRRYNLVVADSDGENPNTIVTSIEPMMSPAWSPDGRRLAYVSFENKLPQVFVQELASGRREVVSSRSGVNGAPAWSPDGTKLALALSTYEGNLDLYVLELRTKKLTRVTTSPAIDTEPSWFPDGKRIAFTSDRGGGPQVYEVDAEGKGTRRLSFEGDWNARPVVAPDGRSIALITREDGQFRVGVLDARGALRVLTDGRLDESPSFAPNSSIILYATEHKGRGVLAAVSTDGRVRQRLALAEGDVREPAWSPYPPARD